MKKISQRMTWVEELKPNRVKRQNQRRNRRATWEVERNPNRVKRKNPRKNRRATWEVERNPNQSPDRQNLGRLNLNRPLTAVSRRLKKQNRRLKSPSIR